MTATHAHFGPSLRTALITLLLSLSPLPALAGVGSPIITIDSPDWFINISEFGYSDIAADVEGGGNAPLYFREYLSGEWGGALHYTGASGSPWIEPLFVFPDWPTLSTFTSTTPVTDPPTSPFSFTGGFDETGGPIWSSTVENAHFLVKQTYEFLDTVDGIAQGNAPASAGGPGASLISNRFVFKQTLEITNKTPEPITNVFYDQFLHGLHSTRAVYDDRNYGEGATCGGIACSAYHHDITLTGKTRAFVDLDAPFTPPPPDPGEVPPPPRATPVDSLFSDIPGADDAFFEGLLGLSETEIETAFADLGLILDPGTISNIARSEIYAINEDIIAFHVLDPALAPQGVTAPLIAAWEVGRYGTRPPDDHVSGKPSVGVHLSIESGTLDGTDLFDEGDLWVSGAQKLSLGTLNPDTPYSFHVLLSIQTSESIAAVPLPAGLPLLGSALAGLLALRRRQA